MRFEIYSYQSILLSTVILQSPDCKVFAVSSVIMGFLTNFNGLKVTSHCFLNYEIWLVCVSDFYEDLDYVSYKVFLIKGTACNKRLLKGWPDRRVAVFHSPYCPSPAHLPKSKCQHACKQNFQLNELMVCSFLCTAHVGSLGPPAAAGLDQKSADIDIHRWMRPHFETWMRL